MAVSLPAPGSGETISFGRQRECRSGGREGLLRAKAPPTYTQVPRRPETLSETLCVDQHTDRHGKGGMEMPKHK